MKIISGGSWYQAKTNDGDVVEFFATASDFFMKDKFFCTFLDFDGKTGQKIEDIDLSDLEIVQ